jgi:hypothetical protein
MGGAARPVRMGSEGVTVADLPSARQRWAAELARMVQGRNSCAGVSGGRTSGEMAFWLPGSTVLTFQNTCREAAGTWTITTSTKRVRR